MWTFAVSLIVLDLDQTMTGKKNRRRTRENNHLNSPNSSYYRSLIAPRSWQTSAQVDALVLVLNNDFDSRDKLIDLRLAHSVKHLAVYNVHKTNELLTSAM